MTDNDRANFEAIMEQTPPELRHRQRLDLLTSWWWREPPGALITLTELS